MKTATEIKKITLSKCEIGKFLEEKVAPLIEEAANCGKDEVRICTDNIPNPLYYSRAAIIDRVDKYLQQYGYTVIPLSDKKHIDICW